MQFYNNFNKKVLYQVFILCGVFSQPNFQIQVIFISVFTLIAVSYLHEKVKMLDNK